MRQDKTVIRFLLNAYPLTPWYHSSHAGLEAFSFISVTDVRPAGMQPAIGFRLDPYMSTGKGPTNTGTVGIIQPLFTRTAKGWGFVVRVQRTGLQGRTLFHLNRLPAQSPRHVAFITPRDANHFKSITPSLEHLLHSSWPSHRALQGLPKSTQKPFHVSIQSVGQFPASFRLEPAMNTYATLGFSRYNNIFTQNIVVNFYPRHIRLEQLCPHSRLVV